MNNEYCFCPNFLSSISGQSIIEALVEKKNSVFFDDENRLMQEYSRILGKHHDTFSIYTLFEYLLPETQKIISPSPGETVDSQFLLNTISGVSTSGRKFLASPDRQAHNAITNLLRQKNIHEIFPHNFALTYNSSLGRRFDFHEFKLELEHSLSLVIGEKNGKKENEYNTTLASCLKAKRYIVCDQTLHGRSSSGKSHGSLDLAIYDDFVRTIVEPLFLKGMEEIPFYGHLNKLVDNYNPLRVNHTFLIVYYSGKRSNFCGFVESYGERLKQIDTTKLNQDSDWQFLLPEEKSTEYCALRVFEQQGKINGTGFTCTHMIADFSQD